MPEHRPQLLQPGEIDFDRFVFHFTPKSCSWLNAVETLFSRLTRRRLKRGVFRSIVDLQAAINRFLRENNDNPKPFVWTADPDKIIASVKRGYRCDLTALSFEKSRPGVNLFDEPRLNIFGRSGMAGWIGGLVMQRRLAAILFADIAGYTRLMDQYEAETHARLMAVFSEIVEPMVAAAQGTIVKSTGHGLPCRLESCK